MTVQAQAAHWPRAAVKRAALTQAVQSPGRTGPGRAASLSEPGSESWSQAASEPGRIAGKLSHAPAPAACCPLHRHGDGLTRRASEQARIMSLVVV